MHLSSFSSEVQYSMSEVSKCGCFKHFLKFVNRQEQTKSFNLKKPLTYPIKKNDQKTEKL